MRIRGFAIPYLEIERCGDRLEYVAPDAFAEQLVDGSGPRPFLNVFDHDADAIADVELFDAEYGAGFEAEINDADWRLLKARLGIEIRCSIHLIDEVTETELDDDARRVTRIISGRIAHITLADAVVYSGTAAWPHPDDIVDVLTGRAAICNSRWEIGRAAWERDEPTRLARRKRATPAAMSAPRPSGLALDYRPQLLGMRPTLSLAACAAIAAWPTPRPAPLRRRTR